MAYLSTAPAVERRGWPTREGSRETAPAQRCYTASRHARLCAWCVKEGKPEAEALIGEKEPLEDAGTTHGICPRHRQEVEERAASLRTEAERQRAEAEELRQRVDP